MSEPVWTPECGVLPRDPVGPARSRAVPSGPERSRAVPSGPNFSRRPCAAPCRHPCDDQTPPI
eukprot:6008313-Prymnesium_polylepis.1